MTGTMKRDFVEAYTWMYGASKKEAERAYSKAAGIADYSYIKEIIICYQNNER